jgi:hypothetical protein
MVSVSSEAYEASVAAGEFTGPLVAEEKRVGKRWDILARILADGDGAASSAAAWAIEGGQVLPLDPGDYGGVRILSAAEVDQIARALQEIDAAEFSRRFYERDFTGLYGAEGGRPAGDHDNCFKAYEIVRDFYRVAAADGLAMVLYLE